MAAVADIRNGLVTNLRTKFATTDYQITGYTLSAPTPPCFDIELAGQGVTYDQTMAHGYDEWTFTVRALVPKTSDVGSQVTLDHMIDSSGELSVKQALESDVTLAGVVDALHVTSVTGPRTIGVVAQSQPTNVYHGCEWTVTVYARGTS